MQGQRDIRGLNSRTSLLCSFCNQLFFIHDSTYFCSRRNVNDVKFFLLIFQRTYRYCDIWDLQYFWAQRNEFDRVITQLGFCWLTSQFRTGLISTSIVWQRFWKPCWAKTTCTITLQQKVESDCSKQLRFSRKNIICKIAENGEWLLYVFLKNWALLVDPSRTRAVEAPNFLIIFWTHLC